MKNGGVIYCLLLAALALVGCGNRQVSRNLQIARELMDSIPDSTYALVTAINPESLSGEKRALHSLLLAHSRYRTYRDDTSDSLASDAVNYYSNRLFADPELLTAALFIQGRNRLNADRYEAAMESAVRSLCEAQTADNILYQARAHELIADIYATNYLGAPAADHYRRAARAYSAANKPRHSLYAAIREASVRGSIILDLDGSISALDSMRNEVSPADTAALLSIASAELFPLYYGGHYRRAENTAEFILKTATHYFFLFDAYDILANVALDNKEYSRAEYFTRQLENILHTDQHFDSVRLLLLKQKRYRALGETEKLIDIQDTIIATVNSISHKSDSSLATIELHMERLQHAEAQQRAKEYRLTFSCILIAAFILLALSTYYIILIRRNAHISRLTYMKDVSELCKQITHSSLQQENATKRYQTELSTLTTRLANTIASQMSSRISELNNLCNEFFDSAQGSRDAEKRLYSKVRNLISSLHSPQYIEQLEESLKYLDQSVKESLSALKLVMKPHNYEFMIYVLSGFSHKALCVIFNLSNTGIYSRKQRLKEQLNGPLKEHTCPLITHLIDK